MLTRVFLLYWDSDGCRDIPRKQKALAQNQSHMVWLPYMGKIKRSITAENLFKPINQKSHNEQISKAC